MIPAIGLEHIVNRVPGITRWQLTARVLLVKGLRVHLTTQADDSHAAPVQVSPEGSFLCFQIGIQAC